MGKPHVWIDIRTAVEGLGEISISPDLLETLMESNGVASFDDEDACSSCRSGI